MRKFFFFALIGITGVAFADSWVKLPVGSTTKLTGIVTVSRDVAWTVGENGIIFQSLNGGATWKQRTIYNRPLQAVAALDTLFTLAAGDGGETIYTNGLANTQWKGSSITPNVLRGISNPIVHDSSHGDPNSFVDEHTRTFFAVGDRGCVQTIQYTFIHSGYVDMSLVWHYADTSYLSYSLLTQPLTTTNLRAVAVDKQTVYAVGAGGVFLRSNDVGATWSEAVIDGAVTFNSIVQVGQSRLLAIGDSGRICVSSNRGKTWTNIAPTGLRENLHQVSFQDSSTGVVVGDNAMILVTTDGGTTWVQQAAATFANLRSVSCYHSETDGDNWLICGDSGTVLQCHYGGSSSSYDVDARDFNFGGQPVFSRSQRLCTVTNTSIMSYLTVRAVSLSPEFTVAEYHILDPQQPAPLTITFTPADTGSRTGTLLLYTNASWIPDTIIVHGAGMGAIVALAGDTVMLDAVEGNSADILVLNSGNIDLTATVKFVSDTNFEVTPLFGSQSQHDSVELNVQVKHGSSHDITAFFVVKFNDFRHPNALDTFVIVARGVVSGVNDNAVSIAPVNCYPNPVRRNDMLTFQTDRPATVRIMDVLGCPVMTKNGSGTITLSPTELPSGVYWYELSNGNMRRSRGMFVVQ